MSLHLSSILSHLTLFVMSKSWHFVFVFISVCLRFVTPRYRSIYEISDLGTFVLFVCSVSCSFVPFGKKMTEKEKFRRLRRRQWAMPVSWGIKRFAPTTQCFTGDANLTKQWKTGCEVLENEPRRHWLQRPYFLSFPVSFPFCFASFSKRKATEELRKVKAS